MKKTYYIRFHDAFGKTKFDKIVYSSSEDRPRFHKVEALSAWQREHKGHNRLTISSVFTVDEFKKLNK